jgi:hypothetical protein
MSSTAFINNIGEKSREEPQTCKITSPDMLI